MKRLVKRNAGNCNDRNLISMLFCIGFSPVYINHLDMMKIYCHFIFQVQFENIYKIVQFIHMLVAMIKCRRGHPTLNE